ncbi:hypothetical protein H0H93_013497 [Arthromyces matolae]|nr:hypothetical protein H0H93_013497 [Arthromyces matolae]
MMSIMRLTEACLFACLLSSFATSTPIPLPPLQTVSALTTRRAFYDLDPVSKFASSYLENLQSNVHMYGLGDMKGVPKQDEMDQYTDKVVLATKFALAAGAHMRGSIASVNEAVVKVATVVKDQGGARYKTMHHAYNNDLWVFPEFQATDMADQSLGEKTKTAKAERRNKAIKDLSTSSVLQVAGLVAQLVVKYPTETPATIKGRLLGKGLIQTWPNVPDRYILEFPILEDSDVFRSIADQPTSPLNNEGHTSASGSSILSPHASSSNTIQPGSSPHLDSNTISDATAFRETQRMCGLVKVEMRGNYLRLRRPDLLDLRLRSGRLGLWYPAPWENVE